MSYSVVNLIGQDFRAVPALPMPVYPLIGFIVLRTLTVDVDFRDWTSDSNLPISAQPTLRFLLI
jgi:hypothetical protein